MMTKHGTDEHFAASGAPLPTGGIEAITTSHCDVAPQLHSEEKESLSTFTILSEMIESKAEFYRTINEELSSDRRRDHHHLLLPTSGPSSGPTLTSGWQRGQSNHHHEECVTNRNLDFVPMLKRPHHQDGILSSSRPTTTVRNSPTSPSLIHEEGTIILSPVGP